MRPVLRSTDQLRTSPAGNGPEKMNIEHSRQGDNYVGSCNACIQIHLTNYHSFMHVFSP
ncbi:MAG: hypothetical protein M0Q47_03560 [Methanothrix sp.]|nr:hypothetical protein [Methanothrix sp.]